MSAEKRLYRTRGSKGELILTFCSGNPSAACKIAICSAWSDSNVARITAIAPGRPASEGTRMLEAVFQHRQKSTRREIQVGHALTHGPAVGRGTDGPELIRQFVGEAV